MEHDMIDLTRIGPLTPANVDDARAVLDRRSDLRLETIRALETDVESALELVFDLDDAQRAHLATLRETAGDRVLASALAWALRTRTPVDFRVQQSTEHRASSIRIELETGSGKRQRRLTVICVIVIVVKPHV
jgi:hypothetical protein